MTLTSRRLTADDKKLFKRLKINETILRDAGVRRLTNKQARSAGFACKGAGPLADLGGIEFPYLDDKGKRFNARIRRDHAEFDEHGKEKNKYLSLSRSRALMRGLYWAPGDLARVKANPDYPVVLVEAEKSVLAVASYASRAGRRIAAAGIGGCRGWMEAGRALADLGLLQNREVSLLLDANVATNAEVQKAERALATHLMCNLNCRLRMLRLPLEENINGPDDFLAERKDLDFQRVLEAEPLEPWLDAVGESYEKYLSATPPEFVIKDFLPGEGATLIGGLSGHGKTFLLLSMVRCLLTGEKLFGYFPVLQKAKRVIYLTPEIGLGAFKLRAEKFKLGPYIKTQQLLVRTLSAYPPIELTDPDLLLSARSADVFLDTVIRFVKGDENQSTDNDRGLAAGIFRLLSGGARTITGAAHSPKGTEKMDYMSLENMLRGSGDIGAMVSAAWGVRMIDRSKTLLHVQNIKPRDFEPPPPFQIQGRPHINQGEGFQIALRPGEAGQLEDYIAKPKPGRKPDPARTERTALITKMVGEKRTREEISAAVKEKWTIAPGTLDKEIRAARPTKF